MNGTDHIAITIMMLENDEQCIATETGIGNKIDFVIDYYQ